MSKILDRLKNLENERQPVLRTADPVVSRSLRSTKKKTRSRVTLFVAILIACAAAAYYFKSYIFPAQPLAVATTIDFSKIEDQKNELAVTSYKQGDYKKSAEELETLTKAHPERAEFHVNLAMAYQQLSQFDKAQEQLQLAIKLDPKDSYALNNLGLLALQTKQEKLAEESFTKAFELNSKSPEITLNLASFYEKTGQLKKSVAAYQMFAALPTANQATVELVRKRIPRLNSLSLQDARTEEEEGT